MNRQRALPFIAGSEGKSRHLESITADNAATYKTTFNNSLLSVRVYGNTTYDLQTGERISVGVIGNDGNTRIGIRVHNECYLDGYELARVLREKGSVNYAGEYDSEHFLYRVTSEQTELLGDLDFTPGDPSLKLTFDAIIPEALADATSFGMYLKSSNNGKYSVARKTTGSGISNFSASIQKYLHLKKICQAAGSATYDIPIKYSSLKLYTGSTVPESNYIGFTQVFDIGAPLLSSYFDGVQLRDVADLTAGTVTHKIGVFSIDENTQINKSAYAGVLTFAIPLPSDIIGTGLDCDYLTSTANPYDMIDTGDCFYVPEGDGNFYVYLNEEITEVVEAREYLVGMIFYYHMIEQTRQIEKLQGEIPVGTVVVEACTNIETQVEIDYYE